MPRKKAVDGFDDVLTNLQILPEERTLVVRKARGKGAAVETHHLQPSADNIRTALNDVPIESAYEREIAAAQVDIYARAWLGGKNQIARARAAEKRRKGPAVEPEQLLLQVEQFKRASPGSTNKDFWREHYPTWTYDKFRTLISRARKTRN